MKNWMKVLVMSSVVVVLASCSSTKTATPGGPNENAQTYGLGQKGALNGTNGNAGQGGVTERHVNAMTAPANQVYYFDYDQSQVSPSDLRAATIQATYIASHKNATVRLEGNTDDHGSREYNVALGWRRAQAVARVLEQQGVAKNQITMVSYGKEHPVASGDDEQSRSLNRRVDLIYVQK